VGTQIEEMTMGQTIKVFREYFLNKTVDQFARSLGTSRKVISRIEKDLDIPTFELSSRMQEKYGLSAERLAELVNKRLAEHKARFT
jgi:transcriptional regulator with XRE-family HTH domain